jgi:SdrD B-like protein
MRGSIVVLALAVTPLVARVSHAQHRPHWQRHDMPAASRRDDDDRKDERKSDDKKCEERKRGNPSEKGLAHRADPRTKGNKDCDLGSDDSQTPPPPPPPPAPVGHTQVQGSLFFDIDRDGAFGPDEVALAGWSVQVFGPMSASAVTDGNGAYTISGLTPGMYTVCVMPPMGWTQTAPSAGTGPSCSNGTVGISVEAPALVGDVWYSGVDFGFISN